MGPIEPRYAGIRLQLEQRRVAQVRYAFDGDYYPELLYQAQYALAPAIVARDAPGPYTLLELEDPADLDAMCQQLHARPILVGNGLALLVQRESK